MGKRNTGRKLAMQILYQAEVRACDVANVLDHFWEVHEFEADTTQWANELATKAWNHRSKSDPLIKKLAIGWDFDRINPIDKAVLRIAFYELDKEKLAANIVINEAVEMCKKYSTDDSPRFINGILGQYVKECLPE